MGKSEAGGSRTSQGAYGSLGTGGIYKTFLAEGDEAIMPDPSFSLYELNVRAAGATPVKSPLDENLQYNPCDMLRLITPKTKKLSEVIP